MAEQMDTTLEMEEKLSQKYDLREDPVYVPEPAIKDPVELVGIYDQCCGLFSSHKITPSNAFSLKLIECFDEILNLDTFDKTNMQNVGRILEVGTKIFSSRVEHTHDSVIKLADAVAEKKKKREVRGPSFANQSQGNMSIIDEAPDSDEGEYSRTLGYDGYPVDYFTGDLVDDILSNDGHGPNKNIRPAHEFDMEYADPEENGEMRRQKLKEKFDSFALSGKKFDYASMIFTKKCIEGKREVDSGRNLTPLNFNPLIVNQTSMQQFRTLDFQRFQNDEFDQEKYDIWGNSTAKGSNKNPDKRAALLEKRKRNKNKLTTTGTPPEGSFGVLELEDPIESDPLSPDEPFGMDSPEINVPEYLLDDYNPLDENGKLKEVYIEDFPTLDHVDDYYDVLKKHNLIEAGIMGWKGPNFARNRRPIQGAKEPRRRKTVADPVKLAETDWLNPNARYQQVEEIEIELDDDAIRKWATSAPSFPYMECDEEIDDDEDLFNESFVSPPNRSLCMTRLTTFFLDRNRNIFDGVARGAIHGAEAHRNSQNSNNDENNSQEHVFEEECPDFAEGLDFARDELQNDNEDVEGVRELLEQFSAMGTDRLSAQANALAQKQQALGVGQPFDFASEADEYPLTRYSETDTLKYSRRLKPINISKVKSCITRILKTRLCLDEQGKATKDEQTEIDMMNLMTEMFRELDDTTIKYLSISITLVATLHVIVDLKLMMDSGKLGSKENPMIICPGKKWVHLDNIPGVSGGFKGAAADEDEPIKKKMRSRPANLPIVDENEDSESEAPLESSVDSDDEFQSAETSLNN